MNDDIQRLANGRDAKEREIGVSDIQDTTYSLNEAEERISRCLEGQLMLARAARYLRMEVNGEDPDLAGLVDLLGADIQGVKERSAFEHDKVRFLRFLQQSILATTPPCSAPPSRGDRSGTGSAQARPCSATSVDPPPPEVDKPYALW